MNTKSPSHIMYSTPTGPRVGRVLAAQATGYLVEVEGDRVFVNYGFVH